MGVGFSHCDARWSYGGFGEFRRRLAGEIGFELESMESFGGDHSWDEIKDAAKPLLNHSDCDGELSPDECRQVAPRLRELVAGWPDDRGKSDAGYDRMMGERLAGGMDEAAKAGEPLRFR